MFLILDKGKASSCGDLPYSIPQQLHAAKQSLPYP